MSSFTTSVTKKVIMSISGLMLAGFLIVHMTGNTLMYMSAEAFNNYAHKLTSLPIIYIAEGVLAAIFLVHIIMGLYLAFKNYTARPVKYYGKKRTGRGTTLASQTMPYTGLLILAFMIIHLVNLKYGAVYHASYSGHIVRDLYRLGIEFFHNPFNTGAYIAAMILLGVHVSHGFHSAFQSLGLNHDWYTPKVELAAKIFSYLIFFGFSSFVIWSYLISRGGNL